jgi:HSP20 family protein
MARRDIDRLQGEIEELFADLWQVPRFSGLRSGFRPAVDCWVTEEPRQLVVVVELAGVEPESIDIAVEERALTISGSRPRPRVPGQVYQQAEIEYGRFERRITLEQNIDTAAASATYEVGMLTLTLPIAARAQRREGVVIVVRRDA